jgi:DNA-binding SARP family transcriptional activator/tetratricopeptide (TPR) repeat protein
MTKFGVLGPLSVESTGGGWLKLRGDRQRSLLATLLFHANRQVPVDTLVDALWPDVPPKSYTSNLHTYVSRLRERLGGTPIDHTTRGYCLRVRPEDLDLLVFGAEAEAGRRAAATGDPAGAAAHLRRALGQWRGPVLDDVHLPLLAPEVARLEAERQAVLEDRVDAELASGGHTGLIGELQARLGAEPLAERAAAQLMTALQRSGRQAEALAVYQRVRAALVEEMGVEPGDALRRVHAAVLRGEDAGPRPPVRTVTTGWPICQLPPTLTDFSGRASEVGTLTASLTGRSDAVAVVVLSGQPGSGKSTLAVRTAHGLRAAFPDGQLFVQLSGAGAPRDVNAVLADLLRTLGVHGPAIPDDPQARAATYRGLLTDRKVLVVLDDAADPAQVRPLLPGTPGCAVLITSRRRLSGLDGADRVALGPLAGTDARLLLERIAGPGRVAGAPADAARITAACGYLPLALRIAGTRLAIRPHQRLGLLAESLEDETRRLDELAVSDLELRASIAQSYQALSPVAQRALRSLTRWPIPDQPAWAVTALIDDPAADTATEELIESSLLEPIGTDATGEPRYRLHDMVRVFASELGTATDSHAHRTASARALTDAVLGLADVAAQRLPWTLPMPRPPAGTLPPQPLPAALVERLVADPGAWFGAERVNLVAAIGSLCRAGWCGDAGLLLERLSTYFWLNGNYTDMRTGYETLREHTKQAGEHALTARAEANLALLAHARGQFEQAAEAYQRCAGELERLGEWETLAWVTNDLADCLLGLGRPEESLRIANRAHGGDLAAVRRTISGALNRLGRSGESVRIDTETLAMARETGDSRQIGVALQNLSWSLMLTGQPEPARELVEESILLLRRTSARSPLARSLRTLGAIQAGRGAKADALSAYTEARAIARELNERARELSCTRAIAAGLIGEGRTAEAIPELRRCLEASRSMGGTASAAITLRILAKAHRDTGEAEAASAADAEAAFLSNPLDASASTVTRHLLELAAS